MKWIKYVKVLTTEDCIDITLKIEKKTILKLALNYRALIDGEWKEVYRIDNFHGFLHEQKFWRGSEPIMLKHEESIPLNEVRRKYTYQIFENFKKYRFYFEEAMKGQKSENEN